MTQQKSAINIVFGAMTFGSTPTSRTPDISVCAKILDIFQSHGHNEIDTARFYNTGTSEEYLGKLDMKKRGIVVATKLYPTKGTQMPGEQISHSPADLRKHLLLSLQALQADKVDMWYLHGPDRSTPYEETLREVNNLHKEGYFRRFGLSNFMSWEVAQICGICEKNGWIKPVVYQGIYNVLHRAVEPELFPCLRAHGIAFYAFNPLGGGFLTGKVSKDSDVEKGSRFDSDTRVGQMYRQRYWNDKYFTALDMIKAVGEKHGLSMTEISLRWMSHHSFLKRQFDDAILIGASSINHIEQNLVDLEKPPLPEDVVTTLNEAYEFVKPVTTKYWH